MSFETTKPDATDRLSRSRLILGEAALTRLAQTRVIIFGVGGVGSWAAEALVRSGLNNLTIVDDDLVAASNINRQLPARIDTVGRYKVEALRDHLMLVNPDSKITIQTSRYSAATGADFHLENYDYVVDAIDSVSNKADLILHVTSLKHPRLFSSMGAALKLDPTRVNIAEFQDVRGCALARALRQRFKRTGNGPRRKFKCVYSDEPTVRQAANPIEGMPNGSLLQVTGTFGFTLASLVIKSVYSANGL